MLARHSSFTTAGACLEAELIKVKRRQGRGGSWDVAPSSFSVLLFRLHGNEPVPHQTYTVEHSLMGKFDLFLGAVGPPSGSSAPGWKLFLRDPQDWNA